MHEIARNTLRQIQKESPNILTILGVSGLIATVLLAIEATPKAYSELSKEENDRLTESDTFYVKLNPLEVVKLVYPYYVPTALSGLLTIGCIIGANRVSARRTAALAALYSIAETSVRDYQEKIVEIVGKNKASKIEEAIVQKKLDNDPIEGKTVIITGDGDHLIYDEFSGRYFKSTIEKIKQSVNEFNRELLIDMYKPINDLYDLWELEPIESGRNMGWDVDNGLLEIVYTTKLATNNEPCVVLSYSVQPKYL